MNEYFDINRSLWDNWTGLHENAPSYRLEDFKRGECVLKPVELEELGGVAGKSMLHLQCHFGLDTMSWARRGAKVTGVDFSPEAVKLARSIAEECGIDATFVESNVYDLRDNLEGEFDIVFASYGVTAWLPDIFEWARIAAHFLKPGGTFYIVEFHPIMVMLDDSGKELAYPYFNPGEPFREVVKGSYASSADFEHETCEWNHPIGDIVTAFVEAGLEIEFLHEFPWSIDGGFKFLELEDPDVPGRYVFKDRSANLPLMFSIKAALK